MIYRDLGACWDLEHSPCSRSYELCLNCGKGRGSHNGWNCDIGSTVTEFSSLGMYDRYLTATMAGSIGLQVSNWPHKTEVQKAIEGLFVSYDPPKAKPKIDETKWQAWAHNVPGECACGIPRERCDYHR